MAMAPARCCGGNMSAIVPPPSVRGEAPAHPARSRKAMSMPMELERAQAMLKTMNKTLQILYRGMRPYISDMGAMTRGPGVCISLGCKRHGRLRTDGKAKEVY